MTSREKVIKGLECCVRTIDDCECADNCPYETQCWDGTMYLDLMRDALALLKVEEPLKPKLSVSGILYKCRACGRPLTKYLDEFCPKCGRPVKWDD